MLWLDIVLLGVVQSAVSLRSRFRGPRPGAVGRYLTEFLTDGRVIDIPWLPRQILVPER